MANKKITEAAAKGALLATDRIPVGAVGDATAYYVTGQNIVDLVGASGDFLADGSVPMTGSIQYAGNQPLLSLAPSADVDHIFMEYAPQPTPNLKWRWGVSAGVPFAGDLTRDDIVMNWGYNQTAQGGRSDATDGSFYLQLENHYWPAGAPDAQYEYHLNAFTVDGLTSYRPFHINVRKDLSWIDHSYKGDSFVWLDRANDSLFGFTTGDQMTVHLPLVVNGTLRCQTSFTLQTTGGSTPSMQIAPGAASVEFTANPITTDVKFYNWRHGTFTFTDFTVNATNNYISGDTFFIRNLASTSTAERVFSVWRTSSGTAANGIGAVFEFRLQTAGGSSSSAARIRGTWSTADTNTRIGEIALEAYDFNSTTVARTGVTVRASAAGEPLLSFYQGVTPVARQVLATGAGATVDNVITALQNLGLVKQS